MENKTKVGIILLLTAFLLSSIMFFKIYNPQCHDATIYLTELCGDFNKTGKTCSVKVKLCGIRNNMADIKWHNEEHLINMDIISLITYEVPTKK